MTNPNIMGWVEEYLAFRRGLGFDLETPAWYFRSLARYAEQVGHLGPITVDLATQWALATRSKDPAHAARRLKFIRPFVRAPSPDRPGYRDPTE